MFYKQKRRHSHADGLSPEKFERKYFNRLKSVYKSQRDSKAGTDESFISNRLHEQSFR